MMMWLRRIEVDIKVVHALAVAAPIAALIASLSRWARNSTSDIALDTTIAIDIFALVIVVWWLLRMGLVRLVPKPVITTSAREEWAALVVSRRAKVELWLAPSDDIKHNSVDRSLAVRALQEVAVEPEPKSRRRGYR